MDMGETQLRLKPVWLTIGYLMVFGVICLSVATLPAAPQVSGGDKVAHLLTYAALMFWFMQIYRTRRSRVAVAVALIALGVGLEFVQGTLPHRSFEVADMVANALGVMLGWLIAPTRSPNILLCIEAHVGARNRPG